MDRMSIKTNSVRIQNRDMAWHIAANILLPADFSEAKKYPLIVSVHPFGSCKEQTSGSVYGVALARKGFVVIAYDASTQGESGGPEARLIEDPAQRVRDITHVVDYAVSLPYVNADQIGLIGVCAGGAYVINSALVDKRVKAVASITPVNVGRLFREGFSNYKPLENLEGMAAQRTKEAQGTKFQINDLLPPSFEAAKAAGVTDIDVLEATLYYKTSRGQTPGGATSMLYSHAQSALSWDAFAFAELLLTQPVIIAVGEKVGAFGAYRDGNEIYGRACASKDRQIISLPNTSHYDLYDGPSTVETAMQKIVPFLKKHITGEISA